MTSERLKEIEADIENRDELHDSPHMCEVGRELVAEVRRLRDELEKLRSAFDPILTLLLAVHAGQNKAEMVAAILEAKMGISR